MEDALVRVQLLVFQIFLKVLILVLMEDALVPCLPIISIGVAIMS